MIKISTTDKILNWNGRSYPCAIGKSGASFDKTEGDHKTPLGKFPLIEIYWRADRIPEMPKLQLPGRALTQKDGWCDDPDYSGYNFLIKLPHTARHEIMWRDDGAYDIVVVIGYNRNPTIRGRGSAIFLHCTRDDGNGGFLGTEGCVAIPCADLLKIIPEFTPQTLIDIR